MTDPFKETLRALCLDRRKALTAGEKCLASARVCARIRNLKDYQQAKHIAIYHAVNGEIDLWELQHDNPERIYYFPAINSDNTISFLPTTPNTAFINNRFNIAEPDVPRRFSRKPNELDIIILPVVAFDTKGTRIGMGGGFYDRTLQQLRPKQLIGVAHDFQHQLFINPDPWDVPLSLIVTPSHTYWSKP